MSDDLDVTADGPHAYSATLRGRPLRVTVAGSTLAALGLTGVEEPLAVRRTLEAVPAGAELGDEVELAELGALVPAWRELVVARLRS
ncbi:hypothetical protein EV189_3910 [Motilibacter rhizosphaerae]|uniref:Uncharacterized protein n=1 Tax=Motilibacter rhizosphaerae TaxID=598652 RepID=A0A4Q7NA80_9ACTN|nr:hypothetical protein [Motilibacter rhizosphaerae]RZS79040.1 hypothetical protein EV189_3910 [Motilibacter rhizosphaerae]